jgi:thioredoxin-like negative regulator of GroEL
MKQTLELTPEDFEIGLFLIDLYMERGELDEANALADQAIQEQGGRRSKELGLLQQRKSAIMGAYGDVSQELSWLEQAFLSNRNDGEIAIQLADLAEQMEEWDVALKALRQISVFKEDLPVSKAEALLRQARIAAYHEEDVKRGILYAKKALQLEPEYEEAQAFLDEVSEE